MARVCRALAVPFRVLHDEDIRAEPPDKEKAVRVRQANDGETKANEDIAVAAGDGSRILVVRPSLEKALGVGRSATDKPRRVAEELKNRSVDALPAPLKDAVAMLLADEQPNAC
jgi:hypothetical protein